MRVPSNTSSVKDLRRQMGQEEGCIRAWQKLDSLGLGVVDLAFKSAVQESDARQERERVQELLSAE